MAIIMLLVAFTVHTAGAERTSAADSLGSQAVADQNVEIHVHSMGSEAEPGRCGEGQVCCTQTNNMANKPMLHMCEPQDSCNEENEFFERKSHLETRFVKNDLCDVGSKVAKAHMKVCDTTGEVCCVEYPSWSKAQEKSGVKFVCRAAKNCVPQKGEKRRIAEGKEELNGGCTRALKLKKRSTDSSAHESSWKPPKCPDNTVCCRRTGKVRGLGKDPDSHVCLPKCDKDAKEFDAAMEECIAEKVCVDTLTRKYAEEDPFTCCGNDVDGYGCWSPYMCRVLKDSIANTTDQLKMCTRIW